MLIMKTTLDKAQDSCKAKSKHTVHTYIHFSVTQGTHPCIPCIVSPKNIKVAEDIYFETVLK